MPTTKMAATEASPFVLTCTYEENTDAAAAVNGRGCGRGVNDKVQQSKAVDSNRRGTAFGKKG